MDGWTFEEKKTLYIHSVHIGLDCVHTCEYMSLPASFGLVKLLSCIRVWGWFHESTDYVLNTEKIVLVNDVIFSIIT